MLPLPYYLSSLCATQANDLESQNKCKLGGKNGGKSGGKGKGSTCSATKLLKIKIGTYPGYMGPLMTEGTVKLEFHPYGTNFAASFDLYGIDSDCGVKCTTASPANCCGVHVHAGTTCWRPKLVKGHYYDNDGEPAAGDWDPWSIPNDTPAIYTPKTGYTKVESSFMLDDGISAEEHVGRAVVIHDADGV